MSFLRKLKDSSHFPHLFVKKHDNYLTNSEQNIDPNQRSLLIYHIDPETEGTFSLLVKNDDLGDLVLDKVCDHYNLLDYKEYFGLKYTLVDEKCDHEILWLDPVKLVGKQLKDTNNVLTFRVKHFPGKPQLIESEHVRYLIFLQIRNYLLKGDLQLALTEETRLAAYAVQAALGDYDPDVHKGNYLVDLKFLSRKSLKAEEMIMELHKQLKGKTSAEMELAFLERASQFDTYGAELIVVKTSKGVPINFGVSHNGIITYLHGTPANIAKIDMFPWTQIGKISFEGRTLKVHFHTPDQDNSEIIKKQVMIFKCNSSRICKHLWKFILDQKAFFNFKRGVDVPKIKSSSRLFSHKSKFRYTGRCESEVIAAQLNGSSISSSTLERAATTSATLNSTNSSISSYGNTISSNQPSAFKRNTFVSTPRYTFTRTKSSSNKTSDGQSTSTQSDSNNNNNNQANLNNKRGEDSQNSPSRKNTLTSLSETVSVISQSTLVGTESTAQMSKLNNNNNNMNINQTPSSNLNDDSTTNLTISTAQATSTPQTNSKLNENNQITTYVKTQMSNGIVTTGWNTTTTTATATVTTTTTNSGQQATFNLNDEPIEQLRPNNRNSKTSVLSAQQNQLEKRHSSISSESKKHMLNSINKVNTEHIEDEDLEEQNYNKQQQHQHIDDDDVEQRFYDHDHYTQLGKQQPNQQQQQQLIRQRISINQQQDPNTLNRNLVILTNKSTKKTSSSCGRICYSIGIILLSLLIIFIIFILIHYWRCSSLQSGSGVANSKTSVTTIEAKNCNYQSTLSKLNDNLNLSLQSIKNFLISLTSLTGVNRTSQSAQSTSNSISSSSHDRWMRWPIEFNTTKYDPLFVWFFSQYRDD